MKELEVLHGILEFAGVVGIDVSWFNMWTKNLLKHNLDFVSCFVLGRKCLYPVCVAIKDNERDCFAGSSLFSFSYNAMICNNGVSEFSR